MLTLANHDQEDRVVFSPQHIEGESFPLRATLLPLYQGMALQAITVKTVVSRDLVEQTRQAMFAQAQGAFARVGHALQHEHSDYQVLRHLAHQAIRTAFEQVVLPAYNGAGGGEDGAATVIALAEHQIEV